MVDLLRISPGKKCGFLSVSEYGFRIAKGILFLWELVRFSFPRLVHTLKKESFLWILVKKVTIPFQDPQSFLKPSGS